MADLLGVRRKVIEWSGRYELVLNDVTWEDNGVDEYIRAGQQFLDMRVRNGQMSQARFVTVTTSHWNAPVDDLYEIARVVIRTATQRIELQKKSYFDFVQLYPAPVSEYTYGVPEYFCLGYFRSEGDNTFTHTIPYYIDPSHEDGRGSRVVIFMPPVESNTVIEIWGSGTSNTLIDNTDRSYWTDVYPDLLAWTALRQMEVSYRNTQGVHDWDAQIRDYLFEIDKSFVVENLIDKINIRDI
jgi:hypothetical protein